MNAVPPRRSPGLFRLFRWYGRRYVARHFHAVRVSKGGPITALPCRPIIIVMNHPSWWDPLIGLILTGAMPAHRAHYAPIESRGLAQYPFLGRLGFFGVDTGTAVGGLKFLRSGLAILGSPDSILWITAQGEFVDPRDPVTLKEGVGHLAHRLSGVSVVPLVVEYPFWNDRHPEVLVRFGPPIPIESGRDRSAGDWKAIIERALQETQDVLADEARRRDASAFETVLGGAAGVGGVYDVWRRFRAAMHGTRFQAEHSTPSSLNDPCEPVPISGRAERGRMMSS